MVIRNKTAPSVLKDFLTHDPCATDTTANAPCQHRYATKYERSTLPPLDEQPNSSTRWNVTCTCQICRCNLEVCIDFTKATWPCPNQYNPLHHLRYERLESDGFLHLTCTENNCQADIYARIRPPFLNWQDVLYLTDRRAIQSRLESILNEGRKLQDNETTTYQCLRYLRAYVDDALRNEEDKRIHEGNKKFKLAIGNEGEGLMKRLGFSYQAPEGPDGFKFWYLPKNVQRAEDISLRETLERVKDELNILMQQRPDKEKAGFDDESVYKKPANAVLDLERALGTLDYDKKIWPRRAELSQSLQSSYQILGVLPDFSPELISWAYDRQIAFDPGDAPTYFEHFKEIASATQDEILETKAMTLESEGQVSAKYLPFAPTFAVVSDLTRDVEDAYKCIGIKPEHTSFLEDKVILDHYRSRVGDVSEQEQRRMKEALRVIALSRSSRLIMEAASDTITNYDQALEYLGAEHGTPDDFIIALKVSKIEENKANEENARKALEIIANHRKSDVLRKDLAGVDAIASNMSLQEAYAYLGVDDPQETTDQQILDAFSLSIFEPHDQAHKDRLREAVGVVARERDSVGLNMALRDDSLSTSSAPAATPISEPRGLRNIGNTCYLNSLLQYLFTIRPVKGIVMNYEPHQQEVPDGRPFLKRVGDSQIKKQQVIRAKEWISELNDLFKELVTSRSAYVTPQVNLARLTLSRVLDSETVKSASARRRSTLTGQDSPMIRSPSSPLLQNRAPRATTITENSELVPSPKQQSPLMERRFSSASTVLEVDGEDDQGTGNKRIEPVQSIPEVAEEPNQITNDMSTEPMEIDQPKIEINGGQVLGSNERGTLDSNNSGASLSESSRKEPPPVPPRPQTMNDDPSKKDKADYEEYAQQQDVADVIEQVLFQLRFAIKAERYETNGEQIDTISKLFFGEETYTHVTDEGDKPGATEPFQALYLYPSEDCDIYDAIDSSFDKAATDDELIRYKTLTRIPPILQLSFSRVGFDRDTQSSFKIESQVKLKEEIFMDRYMEDEEMLQRRKEAWVWKEELSALKAKYAQLATTEMPDSNLPSVLDNAKAYLAELRTNAKELGLEEDLIDNNLLDALEEASSDVRHEMSALYSRIKGLETELGHLFDNTGRLRYRLHAVFTHRGSSTGGHWFIYLYDPAEKLWRWYNDEYVQRMTDIKAILEPNSSIDGTSSLVVYVQEDVAEQILETVRREPEEEQPYVPPPPPYQDESSNWPSAEQAQAVELYIERFSGLVGTYFGEVCLMDEPIPSIEEAAQWEGVTRCRSQTSSVRSRWSTISTRPSSPVAQPTLVSENRLHIELPIRPLNPAAAEHDQNAGPLPVMLILEDGHDSPGNTRNSGGVTNHNDTMQEAALEQTVLGDSTTEVNSDHIESKRFGIGGASRASNILSPKPSNGRGQSDQLTTSPKRKRDETDNLVKEDIISDLLHWPAKLSADEP